MKSVFDQFTFGLKKSILLGHGETPKYGLQQMEELPVGDLRQKGDL